MSVLPVNVFGDKILRKKASQVSQVDSNLISFINDMFDTMYEADGIGLAANQVGNGKSLFIVDLSVIKEYSDSLPIVFINPKIISRSTETCTTEEGCLSLPGLRAEVVRPKSIKIVYRDILFKEQTLEVDGFLATVIQHEYDHLLGVVFTDKLPEDVKSEFAPELTKIKSRKVKVDYEITPKEK